MVSVTKANTHVSLSLNKLECSDERTIRKWETVPIHKSFPHPMLWNKCEKKREKVSSLDGSPHNFILFVWLVTFWYFYIIQ